MNTKFLIVWGMHRSGTSLLSRGLKVFKADLGDNLYPAQESNPKGHWEDMELLSLNEAILQHLGMAWDTLASLSEHDVRSLSDAGFADRASVFLKGKMASTSPMIGLKEPRMSRLLPFWKAVFARENIVPLSFVIYRNPASVAASLAKRAAFYHVTTLASHKLYAYYFWLSYMYDILIHTADYPRVLIEYETLVASPRATMSNVAEKLNLEVDRQELDTFCNQFVEQGLCNNMYSLQALRDDPVCPEAVMALYSQLLQNQLAMRCPEPQEIEELFVACSNKRMLADLVTLLDQASATISELHAARQALQTELAADRQAFQTELAAVRQALQDAMPWYVKLKRKLCNIYAKKV